MRPVTRVRKRLKTRAELFNCSYRTTWENHMTREEKERLEYEDVLDDTMRPEETRP